MLKRKENKKVYNNQFFNLLSVQPLNLGILNQETFANRFYMNNLKIRVVSTCISAARCIYMMLSALEFSAYSGRKKWIYITEISLLNENS